MWFIWPALILLSLLLVYIWYSYFYEPYQIFKRLGIPGPPPEVFFGSYKKLAKFEGGVAGLASQRYLATNYGSICGYYIGYHPYLMVTDPDVLREVLVKKFDHFRSRGVNPVIKFGNTPTLIDSDGEVWKKLRHAISPTFSARKLKMMESLMSRPIDRFLARVKDASSTSTSVDVNSWFSELVTENLLAVFFGLATDVQGDEDGQRLVKCINDSFNATKTGGRLDIYRGRVFNSAFPFLLPLVRAAIQRSAIGRSLANVCAVSSKIVKERRKSKLSHTDFLQQIIDARLSPDEVTSQVISMMFSGNETVTSALTSAAYLLAITPAVQDTLVEEIVEYFRENPTSTLNDALDLRYLDMVVKEVLRFYPPFTKVSRMCEQECVLGGYTIPAGMRIDIPIYYLHHHPDYWTDPHLFNPERFDPSAEEDVHPFTYLPFSDGPRNCIGMRFALMEIKMVLIEILRKYKFVQTSDTQVPMSLKIGVTLGPEDAVMLGFQPHNKQ